MGSKEGLAPPSGWSRGNPERGREFANRTCVGAEPPQGESHLQFSIPSRLCLFGMLN